ncbi:MAG: FAD-dependent thymidylate synthase [bacterium]
MKLNIAGYNIERELIERLGDEGDRPTPETISAAYARVSRSDRPVGQLRREAREEVEGARSSNRTIVFEMGHHSIAEHVVFNIDIAGVSRLAVEALEHHRLNSYTEKSQRYVTLTDDYVVPAELAGAEEEPSYHEIIRAQNRYYHLLKDRLQECVARRCPELAGRPGELENAAKEDARYVTSLATMTQLGMTANARNLELMVRRFSAHPLAEVRALGEELLRAVSAVAPSLVVFTGATAYERATYPRLREFADGFMAPAFPRRPKNFIVYSAADVSLVDYTPNADNKLLAGMLHGVSKASFAECLNRVERHTLARKREILKLALRDLQAYDAVLREFEHLYVSFELVISAACFAQLKRHRMTSLTVQRYSPNVGWTIPESVAEIKEHKNFKDLLARTEEVYGQLVKQYPDAAQYVLTNSHQRRVLATLNARELYHLSRLREDATAQWDIRDIVNRMVEQARNVMPLTLTLAGGKGGYARAYQGLFGEPPAVVNLELPGVRRVEPPAPVAEPAPVREPVPVEPEPVETQPAAPEPETPGPGPDLFGPVAGPARVETGKPARPAARRGPRRTKQEQPAEAQEPVPKARPAAAKRARKAAPARAEAKKPAARKPARKAGTGRKAAGKRR